MKHVKVQYLLQGFAAVDFVYTDAYDIIIRNIRVRNTMDGKDGMAVGYGAYNYNIVIDHTDAHTAGRQVKDSAGAWPRDAAFRPDYHPIMQ